MVKVNKWLISHKIFIGYICTKWRSLLWRNYCFYSEMYYRGSKILLLEQSHYIKAYRLVWNPCPSSTCFITSMVLDSLPLHYVEEPAHIQSPHIDVCEDVVETSKGSDWFVPLQSLSYWRLCGCRSGRRCCGILSAYWAQPSASVGWSDLQCNLLFVLCVQYCTNCVIFYCNTYSQEMLVFRAWNKVIFHVEYQFQI